MITVNDAIQRVLETSIPRRIQKVHLHQTTGRSLAEDIVADHDFPPFDRAMMDGFAIRAEDWNQGKRMYACTQMQAAGDPIQDYTKEECVEIMTGAVVPITFDCIIPVEQLTQRQDPWVTFDDSKIVKRNQHIHFRGTDFHHGDIVLKKNHRIGPGTVAVLAANGHEWVNVWAQPTIAIVSTGDELVEITAQPQPHQIRKSNVHALYSLLKPWSDDISLFHLNDDPDEIERWMKNESTSFDLLLFSGGVSKGKKDFLPRVWQQVGFEMIFHGVAQKPGKPLWFGRKENQILFGFPGNPVSTLFCARRYLIPFLQKHFQITEYPHRIELQENIQNHTALTQWIPVKWEHDHWDVVSFNGSGDLIGIATCAGFIEIHPGENAKHFHLLSLT